MKKFTHSIMHPRNIYNDRLDFKELAETYPEFKENTTLDLKGRVSLDFKNPAALKALSRTLLKRDFDLDVDFPLNTLMPTIPLRLNYILFIEDLLNLANIQENIKGLDIGTGASCVYPLIGAKKNRWKIVGTDINFDSVECAKKNVITNKLEHLINVVQVSTETVVDEILGKDDVRYDFCMCNPPFFGDVNELCSQLKGKPNRPSPKNAYTASPHEVLTEGGEVEFVSRLIKESCKFKNRIRIFTSMLGIKRSIKPLLATLREISDVKSTTVTEFHQGNTTRFCIAWTFDETINLDEVSQYAENVKKTKHKPYVHVMKPFNRNIEDVDGKLKEIFNELQIKYTLTKRVGNTSVQYNIIAHTNTWSHNRRKRRELARVIQFKSEIPQASKVDNKASETDNAELSNSTDVSQNVNLIMDEGLLKRKAEDLDERDAKRPKIDQDEHHNKFLESTISVHILDSQLFIEVAFLDGSGGKDASHQVLQYIKNHFNFE